MHLPRQVKAKPKLTRTLGNLTSQKSPLVKVLHI